MSISSQLGYPDDSLEPTLEISRATLCAQLIAQLDQVDTQLYSARADSMAVTVGDLEVNYRQHQANLIAEGSRLLAYLANQSGLPVYFDRFTQRLGKGHPDYQGLNTQLAIVNYW